MTADPAKESDPDPELLPALLRQADPKPEFTREDVAVLEWRQVLEYKLRAGDLTPALESHVSKYRTLVPALALINHLADGGRGCHSSNRITQCAGLRRVPRDSRKTSLCGWIGTGNGGG
jgi:hypothetical protein